MRNFIEIMEEVKRPYPRCPKRDTFVSEWALNGRHRSTEIYQRWEKRKLCRLAAEEGEAGSAMALTAYVHPLTLIPPFKHLGKVLSESYNN